MKGHATKQDIEAGLSTAADKKGNDKSDANADDGVEMVKGKGLDALGKWIAERHEKYTKPINIIQNTIAVVTLVEKAERKKDQEVNIMRSSAMTPKYG